MQKIDQYIHKQIALVYSIKDILKLLSYHQNRGLLVNNYKISQALESISSLIKQTQSQLENLRTEIQTQADLGRPNNIQDTQTSDKLNDGHHKANQEHKEALKHSQAASYHAGMAMKHVPGSENFISHSASASYHSSMAVKQYEKQYEKQLTASQTDSELRELAQTQINKHKSFNNNNY